MCKQLTAWASQWMWVIKLQRQHFARFLGLHPPPGKSQERAEKRLLELWDSAKLQDAGANLAYLPSLHPCKDGSGSEEQNQSSATKQSIWRGPRATETTAALAKNFCYLNPNSGCSAVRSSQCCIVETQKWGLDIWKPKRIQIRSPTK